MKQIFNTKSSIENNESLSETFRKVVFNELANCLFNPAENKKLLEPSGYEPVFKLLNTARFNEFIEKWVEKTIEQTYATYPAIGIEEEILGPSVLQDVIGSFINNVEIPANIKYNVTLDFKINFPEEASIL